jgi:outer membrane protein assembly factor BamB
LSGVRGLFAIVLVAGVLVAVAGAIPRSARAGAGAFFGFSDDDPYWHGTQSTDSARSIGARAFRLTLGWTPGQTQLNAGDLADLGTAVASASGLRLVLAVYGGATSAPQDDAARTTFCTYVENAVAAFPSINDVVIWNEPNLSYFWRPQFNPDGTSAAPSAYEALLARCWDVLHAFRSTINVLAPATSPHGNDNPNAVSNISHSPVSFIEKMGLAFRASGRSQRLFDTVAQHVYGNSNAERPFLMHPGTTIGEGDWAKLVRTLQDAFGGTAQPVPGETCPLSPCVPIWYMESGFQTTVPPDKLGAYTGTENVRTIPDYAGGEAEFPAPSPLATTAAPDQATQLGYAVRLAYCQPYVSALFNFLLRDEPTLSGWQSGVLWADGTQKRSFGPLRDAVGQLNGDSISCAAPTAPSGLVATATGSPARVTLTWSPSASPIGVSAFTIDRDGVAVAQTNGLTYTDTAVVPGAAYSYTVRADDAAGNTGAQSEPASVTVPADWPSFRFDATNSGLNPAPLGPSVSTVAGLGIRWHARLVNADYSSPAVAGGRVYVATSDGSVHTLDAGNGAPGWTTPLPGPSPVQVESASPTVAGGVVYVATSRYTQLVALDAESGAVLWATHLSDASANVYSSPTVSIGKVYVSADDGYLYALDAQTGTIVWKTLLRTRYPTPAVAGGVLYITGNADSTSAANHLYAVNPDTGALLWEGVGAQDAAPASPAVSGGHVYVASTDGKVYAFPAGGCGGSTCSPSWTSALGSPITASPAVAGGTVFVAGSDGALHALDAGTGAQLWSAGTDAPITASPAVANGVVYVATRAGTIDAFAASGCGAAACTPLWSGRLGDGFNAFYASPAVANGVIYDFTALGDVYALAIAPPASPPASVAPPAPPPPAPLAPTRPRARATSRCVVPKLFGRTLPAARRILIHDHCALGRVHRSFSRIPRGRVISQQPRAGARLRAGGRVALWVSRGRR